MSTKIVVNIIVVVLIILVLYFAITWKSKENKARSAYAGIINKEANWQATQTEKANLENYESNRMKSVGAGNLSGNVKDGSGNNSEAGKEIYLKVNDTYKINPGVFIGCAQTATFRYLTDFASKGDIKGFIKLLKDGIASEECVYFKPGEKVILEETANLQTEIRVKRAGESESYWTIAEAIK